MLHNSKAEKYKRAFPCIYFNNNNLLHVYSAFLGTQSALHSKGGISSTTTNVQHLDDTTAAILNQNTHHTPAYWWRGDRVMKPVSVWGWLGGHYAQRPIGEFGHDAGVTPLLFFDGHTGIFNDHRESGPRFNISSEERSESRWQASAVNGDVSSAQLAESKATFQHLCQPNSLLLMTSASSSCASGLSSRVLLHDFYIQF